MAWIGDRRIAALKHINLLSGCSDRELRQIASSITEIDVPAGRIIARQDEPGSEFFIIVEGRALASRNGQRLATLVPTTYFVEPALLDGGRRTATVTAETNLHLFVLSRGEFTGVCSSFPTVARRMFKEIASRLRQADELLTFMADDRMGIPHRNPGSDLQWQPSDGCVPAETAVE
jgi:CRP/FNR family transcriptional regulator, cyclic AMP receptor protein